MAEHSDVRSWLAALLLGGIGIGIIAAPFLAGSHALWIAFALTVGAFFLVAAAAVVSPVLPVEHPPLRRGG